MNANLVENTHTLYWVLGNKTMFLFKRNKFIVKTFIKVFNYF